MSEDAAASTRTGFLLGTFAYLWWGMIPLFFASLKAHGVGAVEILSHRIVWSLPVMAGLVTCTVGWKSVRDVFRSRQLVLLMFASATLLGANWLLYIYATTEGKVTEAALGYFMLPLANAFLGTMFLGEKLRPAHYPALGLIAVGFTIPLVAAGQVAWVALALPVTFGLYGFVRKSIAVDSLSGLTVESLMMLPFAAGGLLYFAAAGTGHYGPAWGLNGLLMFSGVVTVAPLLTYVMALRRLPLIAVSFLQFVSPTTQMLIALYSLGESPSQEVWAAYICVWAAVVVFLVDAAWQYTAGRRKTRVTARPTVVAPLLVAAKR